MKDGKLVFESDQMGVFAISVDVDEPGNNDGTKAPQTGDNSNVVLWFTVTLCSLAALTVLGKKKKIVK